MSSITKKIEQMKSEELENKNQEQPKSQELKMLEELKNSILEIEKSMVSMRAVQVTLTDNFSITKSTAEQDRKEHLKVTEKVTGALTTLSENNKVLKEQILQANQKNTQEITAIVNQINSNSKPNKQQTHSGTGQLNIESQPSNIKHREDQPRSEEQYDLDEEEYLENRRNYNRSDSVGGNNINSHNIIRNSSPEERGNQELPNGNNGLEGRTDQAYQEKINKLDEIINDKIDKGKGIEIAKKVEFYSEKEKQKVYIEERKNENGKIEIRVSKNPNPFELSADERPRQFKNYDSFNEASSLFMIEKGYKAISVEKTIVYDTGVKEKQAKIYDEKDNLRIKEGLEKLQPKKEKEGPKLERRQERDREMSR